MRLEDNPVVKTLPSARMRKQLIQKVRIAVNKQLNAREGA